MDMSCRHCRGSASASLCDVEMWSGVEWRCGGQNNEYDAANGTIKQVRIHRPHTHRLSTHSYDSSSWSAHRRRHATLPRFSIGDTHDPCLPFEIKTPTPTPTPPLHTQTQQAWLAAHHDQQEPRRSSPSLSCFLPSPQSRPPESPAAGAAATAKRTENKGPGPRPPPNTRSRDHHHQRNSSNSSLWTSSTLMGNGVGRREGGRARGDMAGAPRKARL